MYHSDSLTTTYPPKFLAEIFWVYLYTESKSFVSAKALPKASLSHSLLVIRNRIFQKCWSTSESSAFFAVKSLYETESFPKCHSTLWKLRFLCWFMLYRNRIFPKGPKSFVKAPLSQLFFCTADYLLQTFLYPPIILFF